MSEYWVSRDKYWCKYCKIFIADDKPSRIGHETGLKHKGNYERFIRDIYKRGEKDQKDKAEEAREIARIEAAAALAMGTSRSNSSAAAASSSRKPAAPTDKFANYSTAADLGYEEEPFDEKARLEEEERKKEGTIGQWEVVQKVKPPPPPPTVGGGVKTEDGGDVKPSEEEGGALAAAAERQEEEDRPSQKRWLKEKTAAGDNDEWDPTKVAPLRLKRKILTLKEEEEIKEEEERQRKKRKEEEREKRRKEKERAKGKGPEVTKEGWQQVDVTEEPMLEFDEPEVKPESEEGSGEGGAAHDGEAAEEAKPKVEEEAPKPSGFKKRKMFGAGATRKK